MNMDFNIIGGILIILPIGLMLWTACILLMCFAYDCIKNLFS
jgi:hypothetical protein